MPFRLRASWLIAVLTVLAGAAAVWYLLTPSREVGAPSTAAVSVAAGTGVTGWVDGPGYDARFAEPFGVAVSQDGTIAVSDGGDSHRIRRILHDGTVATIAGGGAGFVDGVGGLAKFDTPSGIAFAPDGALYVADTGNNAVRRVAADGSVTTVAGDGVAGFADGPRLQARFNAPVGVAVDASGRIVVADTYNDRIRVIDLDGQVRTLAGGDRPGNADGTGFDARFDTPCGVAVAADGRVLVADTGNGAVRSITPDGVVATVASASSAELATPLLPLIGLERPIALTIGLDGDVYVADERGDIVVLPVAGSPHRLAGGGSGFADGVGDAARFRRPSGIAVMSVPADTVGPAWAPRPPDRIRIAVADAGNAVVRELIPARGPDHPASSRPLDRWFAAPRLPLPRTANVAPAFDAGAFGLVPLLWPVAPLSGPHEIAGTFAEARGEAGQQRFHAGLDVRRVVGTPVHAVRDGIVSSPIATGAYGTLNEWLRIGPVTYVHIRVGRDVREAGVDLTRFAPVHDPDGRLSRMRVKRGARFRTGDIVGSVNRFNHVHLNIGWPGEEHNPLDFRLVDFADTIPPTIAPHGVRLFAEGGEPLNPDRVVAGPAPRRGRPARPRQLPPVEPVSVSGRVQVVVDAWDQADGNIASRRLGLYALGYQVLDADGIPVRGFELPRETLRFDVLRRDAGAAQLVFASGSGIPVYGASRTRFLYVVTTTYRDGIATPGYWDTTSLSPGAYVLRVFGEDYHGNRATRDVKVIVRRG